MRIIILIISACLLIINQSCNHLVQILYGSNKNINFTDKEEYVKYVKGKYVLNSENLYYIDCTSYYNFVNEISEKKIIVYFATFLDDCIKYNTSSYFNENKSCSGRIFNEIQNPTQEKIVDSVFYVNQILNIVTSERFIPQKGKNNIIMIFSTNLGRFHKNDLIEVQKQFSDSSKYNLIFITLDRICHLQ